MWNLAVDLIIMTFFMIDKIKDFLFCHDWFLSMIHWWILGYFSMTEEISDFFAVSNWQNVQYFSWLMSDWSNLVFLQWSIGTFQYFVRNWKKKAAPPHTSDWWNSQLHHVTNSLTKFDFSAMITCQIFKKY